MAFSRELLEAFRAGQRAGRNPDRYRSSNPHVGTEPGEFALGRYWLVGFERGRNERDEYLDAMPTAG